MNDIYDTPQSEVMKTNQASSDGITDTMLTHLMKAKPWAKFLAIIQYIYVGVMGIGMLIGVVAMGSQSIIAALMILIFGGIFIYIMYIMARYMMRYSKAVEALLESRDIADIEMAQEQFGKYCRFFVILIIIGFIGGIIGAAFMFTMFGLAYGGF